MKVELVSELKQYYRYLRNWKKFKSRSLKGGLYTNASQQLEFYSQFIKPGDLVFDIGANVGDKTDLFLRLGARVVAVEPQESCWLVLKRRFKNQDVRVITSAISAANGEATLFIDKSPTISSISRDWISAVKNSGRFSNHKWPDKITVETTTMDALVARHGRPTFCKIDVEGAELEVLKGLTEPVDVISFEFVSERIDSTLCCIDYLSKLAPAQFNYYLGEEMSFALRNWTAAEKMKRILMTMGKSIEKFGDIYVRFAAV